jgi:hypothetical protein
MIMLASGQASRSLRSAGGFLSSLGVFMPPVLDMNALLSGTEAAGVARVSVRAIVNWRNRGWLPVAIDARGNEIRDGRGRPRYRLGAVLEAEKMTAERCEVVAPRLARRCPVVAAA